MKQLTTVLLTILISGMLQGQNITGQWMGTLKVQGIQLRIVFNISKTDTGYVSTMDSPDQGVKGILVTSTSFENKTLLLTITSARIQYKGVLIKDTTISGDFSQAGQTFPIDLTKAATGQDYKPVRPQEPIKPYPYYSEEIKFENKTAGITLAGTLTLPKKDGLFPAVILITGSGPQNRDEELLGHKPFLILSDFLTRNGIAVLRFDDRGTAASGGVFKTATTLDFSTDIQAAEQFLQTRKEINKKKIGLIGHSEGGIIAPMVASHSKDIAFIVLLAGTGIRGDQLLLLQQALIGKSLGASDSELQKSKLINQRVYEIVLKSNTQEQLINDLTRYLQQALKENPDLAKSEGLNEDDYIKKLVAETTSPWMEYFLKLDPAEALEKVTCPVLALNGTKDLQVPPTENLAAIKKALAKGGNKNVTAIALPGLNHLFQECKTGSPAEYSSIEQTFSPIALNEILKWIQEQVKK